MPKPINTLDDFTREMISLLDEHMEHGESGLSLLDARQKMIEGTCSEDLTNHILLSAFLAGNEYTERVMCRAANIKPTKAVHAFVDKVMGKRAQGLKAIK